MIPPAKLGPDSIRDQLINRIADISHRHFRGDPPTRDDVAYLLDVIAELPHGVRVITING